MRQMNGCLVGGGVSYLPDCGLGCMYGSKVWGPVVAVCLLDSMQDWCGSVAVT